VDDTGVGFEEADVERLFQALYTTKPHGLGMGRGGRLSAARLRLREASTLTLEVVQRAAEAISL
jgi:C4-dicarboxylate-specific signal transduction histidine kinase